MNKQSQGFFDAIVCSTIIAASLVISTVLIFGSPLTISSSKSIEFDKQAAYAGTILATKSTDTVVEVASAHNLKTFVTALNTAGLEKKLSSNDRFTVFAPTDAAFASLPKGTLKKLLKPENKVTLQKILTYHVLPNAIDSKTLKSGQFKTLEGSPLNIKVKRTGITVNNARVIQKDIKASNGVIYQINTVIIPPGLKL
ncbi:fasciclin domain-containing protein [Nostoc sp.]|uniref:fasciclin domain-containing protein n=1 Tax=Nostoc sp. TaxID=1180 RepID=UPI002FF2E788